MPPREAQTHPVGAVVLAAGQSQRMGRPKLVLPWGRRTVIEHVVQTLIDAGISDILVVTGGAREAVEAALANYPVRMVFNPDYLHSEMLVSLQTGLQALIHNSQTTAGNRAVLVVLGDQPSIEVDVVEKIIDAYRVNGSSLIIPSYQMRRGHPWLVDCSLWPDLLSMTAHQTMRDFLTGHLSQIAYIQLDTPGILKDMDTPEDYERMRPD